MIEELINAQTAKIEAQTAVLRSQNVSIESVMRLVIETGEEIKALGRAAGGSLGVVGAATGGCPEVD